MKNYKKMRIWQSGFEIVLEVFKVAKHLPQDEKFGITSQIKRAAISIPLNIAEGSSRKSEKEYAHFIDIAIGSAFELETILLIIEELRFVKVEILKSLILKVDDEQKMLLAFRSKLNF